jgi:hypothetical protein
MNDYYTAPEDPVNYTLARSGAIRTQFKAIEAAFAKFPALRSIREARVTYAVASGTNTLSITLLPAPDDYQDGFTVKVRAVNTNTGAATLNVNGLGAIPIVNRSGANVGAGALVAGHVSDLVYVDGKFRLMNDGTELAASAASALAAANSATSAFNSAGAAAGSALAAAGSESAAAGSASSAGGSATAAINANNSAQTAKTAAETARTGAETARTGAETAETNAEAAQTASEDARDAAVSARNTAQGHASSASGSATTANNAKVAAEAARDQMLSLLDQFDDRYLGSKAADPTVDNDGDPLLAGALYYKTTAPTGMMVYTGSAWVAAYVPGATFLPLAGGDMTGQLKLVTSAAALVPLQFQLGADVSSPENGAMWYAAAGLRFRHGGATYTLANTTQSQTLTNKTLTSPVIDNATVNAPTINGYTEGYDAPAAGTAFSPNIAADTLFYYQTSGNVTITLPSPAVGRSFTIILKYGGSHTLTWAGGARLWPGGSAPTPTSVSGKFDVFSFVCVDGSNWLAFPSGLDL